ncbi:MAG: polymer-forming cytoskeletal protein [Spirochaetes bacterium]|nr:polymer-forming cytoskeletal protein [Spirochaetota bacterium]
MFNKTPRTDYSINSLVGESTSFNGEFKSQGPLRIDGHFIGKIDSGGKVYIGKKGIAECIIIGKNIVIGGTVKGDVYAGENVVALKTAEIFGTIYATSIKMEDGVIFEGECRILSKDEMQELIQLKRKDSHSYINTSINTE